jgi:hypothetical protein
MFQKRPSKDQKRPINDQKRPSKDQKRPINDQKRPSKANAAKSEPSIVYLLYLNQDQIYNDRTVSSVCLLYI